MWDFGQFDTLEDPGVAVHRIRDENKLLHINTNDYNGNSKDF